MSPKASTRNWKPWIAVASAAIVLTTAFATAVHVRAQIEDEATPETTTTTPAPYAEFQYATLTGTNNTLNVTMLPVVLSNGTIVYKNLTIPITVTESTVGSVTTVTLKPGTVTVVASPTPQVSSFKIGGYVGPSSVGDGNALIAVSGPGETTNGATEWSLAQSAGASCATYPTSATWYVGALASNPQYARLKKAGITSTAYSYGIMNQSGCDGNPWWQSGAIVGLSQTGSTLTIVSFTNNSTDQAVPGATITYTLQP